MARRSERTAPTLTSTTLPSSSVDRKVPHHSSQRQRPIGHERNGPAERLAKDTTGVGGEGRGSCQITSGGTEGERNGSEGDAAEADEEADADGNSDALAPSGRATQCYGNQAGLLVDEDDLEDESYNAVDEVSDSTARESAVEKQEEKNIIESEAQVCFGKASPAWSDAASRSSETWHGFSLDGDTLMSNYFGEHYRTDFSILDSEMELFQNEGPSTELGPMSLPRQASPKQGRKAHFPEPGMPPSDSSGFASNNENLNGLFTPCSEHKQRVPETSLCIAQENDQSDDHISGGDFSGYETDVGDTTEEEGHPKAYTTTLPQALLSTAASSSPSLGIRASRMPPAGLTSLSPSLLKDPATPHRGSGPRLGNFEINPTKPYAKFDCTGTQVTYAPAKRFNREVANIGHMHSASTSTAIPCFVAEHTGLTGSLLENEVGNGDFSSQLATDPTLAPVPSVFCPADEMCNIEAYSIPNGEHYYHDDNDGEEAINFGDFLYCSDDSLYEDDVGSDAAPPTPNSTSASTKDLLAHFDKGVIGRFRQGQYHHGSHYQVNGPSLGRHAFKHEKHNPAKSSSKNPRKRKMSGGFVSSRPHGQIPKRRMIHH
ncbi:hypothetical protein ACLMJK_003021 [Lecanora helva]